MNNGNGKQLAKPADLADALNANKEATEDVQQVADHLAVVHAVLDQTVPPGVDGDLSLATEQTAELGKKLGEAAEKLEKVNEHLATEVARKAGDAPG
jgi:ABC-type transporter Mla subunit MlaD